MKKFDCLRCVFLLFSLSTSIQDIQLYGTQPSAGNQMGATNKVDTTDSIELRELTEKLQNVNKGSNIYDID